MENHSAIITQRKRVNITLPRHTLQLLERVAAKGDRSGFLDRAVHFYVQETGRANLKKRLKSGAITHVSRDQSLADEWFFIDEKGWQNKKQK